VNATASGTGDEPTTIAVLYHGYLNVGGVDPLWATAHGESYVQRERGIQDVAYLILYFPSRVIATMRLSGLDPVNIRRITVVGSQKMLVYDDIAEHKVILYDRGVAIPAYSDTPEEFHMLYCHGPETIVPYTWVEPLQAECRAFVEAISRSL
jgi:predicted dehydrogenase